MKDQNVTSLPEMLQMAIDLDVKMLACLMSMDVMEINKEDLIDEVDDVVGAATMLAHAQESQVQYFI
jgi:peroxiredoxin family protein